MPARFARPSTAPITRRLLSPRLTVVAGAIALFATTSLSAQSRVTPATSVIVNRVRLMADNGEGEKARALLDSLIAAAPRESLDAAEGLYWRASLSEQSAGAERDWKQIVVSVPNSPHAPEALLRLSELDMMRNNPAVARQHAQRVLLDYPEAPERLRALLVLAQSYFGERDAPRGCGVLSALRSAAPLGAVELRMQADELQQRCRGVREIAMGVAANATTTPLAVPMSAPKGVPINVPMAVTLPAPVNAATTPRSTNAPAPQRAESSVATAPRPTPSPTSRPAPAKRNAATRAPQHAVGKYTVQVAAYDTRAQADALVRRLNTKRMTARVAGTHKPFRVQVGRYGSHADATAALARMKKAGQKGFVAAVDTP
jgi:cell division septation protein DedD